MIAMHKKHITGTMLLIAFVGAFCYAAPLALSVRHRPFGDFCNEGDDDVLTYWFFAFIGSLLLLVFGVYRRYNYKV